jgi:RNA polymerase sigma-70 factor (ECF subfamily)
MPQKRTVAELIPICLETNSDSAWLELVQTLQPVIASTVLRCVRRYDHPNRAVVDDLVQESFLRLFRDDSKALRTFVHRHEAAIFAFVRVVAASVANDYFRKLNAQKRAGEYAVDMDDHALTSAAQSEVIVDPLLLRDIERHVEGLASDPRDRMIFWFHYRQGFTAADIAALPGIGLTPKGVESCLLRLLKAVKRKMVPMLPSAEGLPPSSALGEMR